MNIFTYFKNIYDNFKGKRNPTPAEFRRGSRKVKNIIGTSIDFNSRHVGKFRGGIVPMRRRMSGVSRTGRSK